MAFPKFQKDPDEFLDYELDFSKYLQGDTITASTFIADTGLTVGSHSFTDSTTTVWLSSGAAGTNSTVVNHITTAAGRQVERSITIQCREL